MIVINPQWQGSGTTSELAVGAATFKALLNNEFEQIPLSTKELSQSHDIIGYNPILEQTHYFQQLISKTCPETIVTFGGDCGVEIIPVSYLNQRYKSRLALIWLDAHADLNTPQSSPSKHFHGMPLRMLLGEGDEKIKAMLFSRLEPEQVFLIGLRDTDPAEEEYIEQNNIFTATAIRYSALKEQLVSRGFTHIYIHLDLDVLDPKEYPFVKCPTAGGLSISEVEDLIERLKNDFFMVGACITESTANKPQDLWPIRQLLHQLRYTKSH